MSISSSTICTAAPDGVAIFGHRHSPSTASCAVRLVRALLDKGIRVELEEDFYQHLASFSTFDAGLLPQVSVFSHSPLFAAMAISLGGDGTFLRTAEKLVGTPTPILGINTGRLGFLADVTADGIENAVRQLALGGFQVAERSLIAFSSDAAAPSDFCPYALNEVAVLKHDNSSLIEVETHVDGRLLTNYVADGLVVCTPTGSTGYALSAGGPILSPGSRTFCLAPVAPHSLTMRPIVLPDDVELQLRVKSRTGHFLVALDGRSRSMEVGCEITLRKADCTVNVVRMQDSDFFHTLRCKLMWGMDQRG